MWPPNTYQTTAVPISAAAERAEPGASVRRVAAAAGGRGHALFPRGEAAGRRVHGHRGRAVLRAPGPACSGPAIHGPEVSARPIAAWPEPRAAPDV